MTIFLKWVILKKSQTQNFLNYVKAYTQIQVFLENTDQGIASDCNPDKI